MQAENVDELVKNLDNFGGIFDIKDLENLKILQFPTSIIVHDRGHWLGIYIGRKSVEIMDSSGFIEIADNPVLYRFLNTQMKHKKISVSPVLQGKSSSACALYVICFLYYRSISHQSICHFINIFTTDPNLNCLIIYRIFNLILGK